MQQLFGPGVVSFLVLKYSLLTALAGLMYAVTRRVTGSTRWAVLAVESIALIYQIFWRWHETHTHLLVATVFSIAFVWALIRSADRGRLRDFMLLAAVLGFGALTQASFMLLALATAAATLMQPAFRSRIYTSKLVASLPITAAILAPYAIWLTSSSTRAKTFASSLLPTAWADGGASFWVALWNAFLTPIAALSPYILFFAIIFPRAFPALAKLFLSRQCNDTPDWTRLLLHTLLLEWGVFLLIGTSQGLQRYSVQDLLPLFLIAVIVLTEGARLSNPPAISVARFLRIALLISATAFCVRLAHMYIHEPICKICRWGEPYRVLADDLKARGFQGGIIYTPDAPLGGNLRALFPNTRVLLVEKQAVPLGDCPPNTCLIIGVSPPPKELYFRPGTIEEVQVPWRHLWKPTGYRTSSWWFYWPRRTSDTAPPEKQ